ncbi:NAD(P)-dependent oxidoreductase [Neobacillus bataviensis]|uniref:NAD(P)-dependent oxidoreductase n=1 Tax=Neobacillus bataviensis TaxID=220685 RepID=UPI001CBC03EB|nr:NAD(P)-dependent oxidoreductase [Neobacillus bataviensis]
MIQTVGFIGLGKMGLPMARNLLTNGYDVYGMDVNDSAISEFQSYGGKTGKLLDWIHNVQTIILMLPSSKIVNQVIDEIIDHYSSESLTIIDMSSSYPEETRTNFKKLEENNIEFLDAPVSGGVKKAVTAELTIMIGGRVDIFTKCKRLLESMGKSLFHVGPIGSGHLIKAINNYLSGTHLLATCEAVQLLERFEVEPETAIHVFNQSTGRSGSTEYKFPSFILTESFDSGFSLELLRKDLEMAKNLFLQTEAETNLPQLVFNRFDDASQALAKDADHTEIYQYVSSYLLQRGKLNEKDSETIHCSGNSSISI